MNTSIIYIFASIHSASPLFGFVFEKKERTPNYTSVNAVAFFIITLIYIQRIRSVVRPVIYYL